MLSKSYKLVEMADLLQINSSSISKEIKRNRVLIKKGKGLEEVCKHTTRFPYCCNSCSKKYNACPFTQFRSMLIAQSAADFRLVHTRVGLNMTPQEYKYLDDAM